jgi:hypothetical protein
MHFELQQRPVAGADFALRLKVEASAPLSSLKARVLLPEGIDWATAATAPEAGSLAGGERVERSLILRALREGAYELRVELAVEPAAGAASTALYSIPLIVGRPGP